MKELESILDSISCEAAEDLKSSIGTISDKFADHKESAIKIVSNLALKDEWIAVDVLDALVRLYETIEPLMKSSYILIV